MPETFKIIQWSTGNVGRQALDAIFDNPGLELVGVWAHSEDKVGKDAGDLVGRPACGVVVSNDIEALLGLGADVVSYSSSGETRPDEALADITRILESGANVVSSSLWLLHPKTADPDMAGKIQRACEVGGTSCLFSGIDPGFANDTLPSVLTGVSQRITQVRVQEILNYANYEVTEIIFDMLGYGTPLDGDPPMILLPGVLSTFWGGTIHNLADNLGIELDSIDEWHERRDHDRDIPDVAGRTIEAGTQAGMRWEIRGMLDGEAVIVLEHVTRIHDDVAPDWPTQQGQGGYHVTISGEPVIECTFHAVASNGETNTGGLIVTAAKLLNSIPSVVAAPPGLLSVNDIPVPTGRGLVKTS